MLLEERQKSTTKLVAKLTLVYTNNKICNQSTGFCVILYYVLILEFGYLLALTRDVSSTKYVSVIR
jgi:hypothetical protein